MTQNGLPLDPTYTGKAFWGMKEYLEKNNVIGKKILFIHTGGTPLYFDYQNGIVLQEVNDYPRILDAVTELEGNLQPSLLERRIDLVAFAEKLKKYGKVWCHYDMGKPVSIIAGYFNDRVGLTAYLTILAVAPEYRGRKMAISLFGEFIDYARINGMKKIKLEVRKHNDIAQNLYQKLGFDFLDDASDTSVYMVKEIESI